MSNHELIVECPEHGNQATAYVCQHLVTGQGLGFHQHFGKDEPDAIFPDAWCDTCEAIQRARGELNGRSFAGIQRLCSVCYQRARSANWPRNTHVELSQIIDRSVAYLQEKQNILQTRYRLAAHERYEWHQEPAQLVFLDRGGPLVIADVQFVGSVSTRTNTWLWSWANKSFLESAKSRIRQVRAFGDERSLLKLACAYWDGNEEDGWQMAAVSAYLLQAKGVYRSPDDRGCTFLVMTDVWWAQ